MRTRNFSLITGLLASFGYLVPVTGAPLHEAAAQGDLARAEQLILAGADIEARDEQTFSPLEYASLEGHEDIVALLVEHGTNVNARDERGVMPLMLAAEGGSLAVTETLLDHGADVNAGDVEGYTALHVAAMAGSTRVAELLIENGADVNAESVYGRTPLNEASDADQRRMVRLLERHGGLKGANARLPFMPKADYVIIDESEPAFLVITGVEQGTAEEEIQEIRERADNESALSLLTWEEFAPSANGIAESFVRVFEYSEFRVVDGLVCLVGTQPGAPWGLTWNGGIALTMMDYNHVRQRFEQYLESPGRLRRLDPRMDPVNPGSVLMFFGCM
jgi:hypothetical protein